MSLAFTHEQQAVIEQSLLGNDLKVKAFAGSGKTTTLRAVADALPSYGNILYLTFSRALADEAKATFPRHVDARTAHSLAFRKVGRAFSERLKSSINVNKPLLEELDLNILEHLHQVSVTRDAAEYAVLGTVTNFSQSADTALGTQHVPNEILLGKKEHKDDIARIIAQAATQVWQDMTRRNGSLYITHDTYLKLYALSNPILPFDTILFDEAQDANPVMLDIVLPQNAQKIFVGDSHQQIYAWRGAVDAMEQVEATESPVTQSWRFGEPVAQFATELLRDFKKEPLSVKGNPQLRSSVYEGPGRRVDAILTRTNVGALEAALSALDSNIKVSVVGGVKELTNALFAAYDLYCGESTSHSQFCMFSSWSQLVKLTEMFNTIQAEYGRYISMVERYTTRIPYVCQRLKKDLCSEDEAELVISTAHKAKGREWDSVRLGEDFQSFDLVDYGSNDINVDTVNLIYVAATRAKHKLYLNGYEMIIDAARIASNLLVA